MDAEAIARRPDLFPDRLDFGNRLVRLVSTSHAILAESAFLDGRTSLSPSSAPPPVTVSLDAFIAAWPEPPPPMRWLFHHSFCGSTLLARTMTVPGQALCLSEPQILTDLAEWRVRLGAGDTALFTSMCSATLTMLSRPWNANEAILCKPSNWINPAIVDFWNPARGDRAVIVEIGARDFLIAALRGGRDRLTFLLRLYERFAAARPTLARLAGSAMPPAGDPLRVALGLIAAMHWMQNILLATGATAGRAAHLPLRLKFPDLLQDLLPAVVAVDMAFGLNLAPEVRTASVTDAMGKHAKQRDQPAPAGEAATNRTIATLHADPIAHAVAYADRLAELSTDAMASMAAASVFIYDASVRSARTKDRLMTAPRDKGD